jgi:hypothetical protein
MGYDFNRNGTTYCQFFLYTYSGNTFNKFFTAINNISQIFYFGKLQVSMENTRYESENLRCLTLAIQPPLLF